MCIIRENPPTSINTPELKAIYETLYDDITVDGKILLYGDRNALGLMACITMDIETCRAHLSEHGMVIEVQGDRNVITKSNKHADILDKKENKLISMFKAFGISPEYRKTTATEAPNNLADGWDEL